MESKQRNVSYLDLKGVLIDYFSKYKLQKVKDALDLSWSLADNISLEDYVQKKYTALCYAMPDLYQYRPSYLIRMILAAIDDKSVREQLSEVNSGDIAHLKQSAAVYDRKNQVLPSTPNEKAMSYDVKKYFDELQKSRKEVVFEAAVHSNLAKSSSSIKTLSSNLIDRLNYSSQLYRKQV